MKDTIVVLLVVLVSASLGCASDEDSPTYDYYCSHLNPAQNFCQTDEVEKILLDVPQPINESTFWVDLVNDDNCYISVEKNAPEVIAALRGAGFKDYEGPVVQSCPTKDSPDMGDAGN